MMIRSWIRIPDQFSSYLTIADSGFWELTISHTVINRFSRHSAKWLTRTR